MIGCEELKPVNVEGWAEGRKVLCNHIRLNGANLKYSSRLPGMGFTRSGVGDEGWWSTGEGDVCFGRVVRQPLGLGCGRRTCLVEASGAIELPVGLGTSASGCLI
jgi:hypothetical protein